MQSKPRHVTIDTRQETIQTRFYENETGYLRLIKQSLRQSPPLSPSATLSSSLPSPLANPPKAFLSLCELSPNVQTYIICLFPAANIQHPFQIQTNFHEKLRQIQTNLAGVPCPKECRDKARGASPMRRSPSCFTCHDCIT